MHLAQERHQVSHIRQDPKEHPVRVPVDPIRGDLEGYIREPDDVLVGKIRCKVDKRDAMGDCVDQRVNSIQRVIVSKSWNTIPDAVQIWCLVCRPQDSISVRELKYPGNAFWTWSMKYTPMRCSSFRSISGSSSF
jgi:hypothetical protein